jgi:hypothetical protein
MKFTKEQEKKCDIEVIAQLMLNRAKKLKLLKKSKIKELQDRIDIYGRENFKDITGRELPDKVIKLKFPSETSHAN